MNPSFSLWVLDGKTPRPATDINEWVAFVREREPDTCRVALTEGYGMSVSTVFLGVDHSFGSGSAPPLLFETMCFGPEENTMAERYSTWEEAEAGHQKWVERVGLAEFLKPL